MAGLSDQQYLLTDQYKDASNFKARVQLHKRFSTNRYGWLQWVFDHLNFSPTSQILDVGCGPGTLWLENADRIPQGCRIILSDFSRGMLLDARQNLSVILPHLTYCNMDIQTISFRDSSFDLVIANHMLYHVPDRNKAFSEVYRVLKPDGILFASTTWIPHLQELRELTERVDPSVNEGLFDGFFGLETGGAELANVFPDVTLRRYDDTLEVTEAEPLIAFVESWRLANDIEGEEKMAQFRDIVRQEIASKGVISVTKDAGAFIACKGPA